MTAAELRSPCPSLAASKETFPSSADVSRSEVGAKRYLVKDSYWLVVEALPRRAGEVLERQ